MEAEFQQIKFTDADIANKDDFIPQGEYNPHKVRPWLLYRDHGIVCAVVFAESLQDALDTAVDADKLDGFQVRDEDRGDYPNDEGVIFLGNAGEPFDIEALGVVELPNPPFSFVALFNAMELP